MKRILSIFLPLAGALLLAGCSEKRLDDVNILIDKTFRVNVTETRTTLDGTSVVFSKGEALSVYDGTANRKFTTDAAGSCVNISGTVSSTATEFYALSPYLSSTVFTKSGTKVTAKTTLSSSQEATAGSFENGVNISASSSSSSTSFSMQNLLAVAKFTLSSSNLDGHKVKSVELSGSYALAGDVVVTYGTTCSISAGSSTVKSVSLSRSNGSALSDGTYYIAVLPNAGGSITMKFTAQDGSVAVKKATLGSAFEAGVIKNLGTVKNLTWTSNKETGWLELPAVKGNEDFLGKFYSSGTSGKNRNYSYNYSYTWYASLWVAYPLTSAHTTGSASSSWSFNPQIDDEYEVHVVKKSYPSSYNASEYSKGHQIPNGDRKSNSTMNKQTYYVTNQTPQIQDGFNGSIWNDLEGAIRTEAKKDNTDTLYIVTGPAYKVTGNEEIKYLTATSAEITPQSLPVPYYYWKALLKVKRDASGNITAAKGIGFWFEHKAYPSKEDYAKYAVSVNTIESRTGFDLFVNLPSDFESAAESNTSWGDFQDF